MLHFVNIGIRHAWFCGGVEWNVSVRGHAAHTCAPVFAAEVRHPRFGPVLRIYEQDRFRGVLWQMDFLLADDVPALLVRPRIVNTRDEEIPTYWWSNIAVREARGHRVLVPADAAFQHDYDRRIVRKPIPLQNGVDISYPTNNAGAHDFFYDIPAGRTPWIASLDGEGVGLIHTSTPRLRGRKLFVWGMGTGGRHWQGQLGGEGDAYVELQGGLAQTQAHYLPMPARARWAWLEAYALMEVDPAAVHGADWRAARRHVADRLEKTLRPGRLERLLAETADLADTPPATLHVHGSGWAGLERRRRAADGERDDIPPGIVFPDEDGGPFAPWRALLADGEMPSQPPAQPPGEWVTGPAWRKRLADAVEAGRGDHWLAWLHLGTMAWRAGDAEEAERAWRTSLDREPSAWACRNLAVLAAQAGRLDEAAELYLQAATLQPELDRLQVECGRALLDAGRVEQIPRWLDALPSALRHTGLIRLIEARAACLRGELDAAEALLERIELTGIREGRSPLTDLWFEIQARRTASAEGMPLDDALRGRVRETLTPPAHLDYRMH